MNMTIKMNEIEAAAKKYTTVDELNKKIRSVQSMKSKLLKQKNRPNYEALMTDILKEEQLLKEARRLMDPKDKPVTEYTQADVDRIEDFDEVMKALKNIQSKKTHTRYLEDQSEFIRACNIEDMLKNRRDELKPIDPDFVRKNDLQTIIDQIEASGDLSQERIVELLKDLL